MIDLALGKDGIAEVRFDTPGEKVNIITEAFLARLDGVLAEIERGCASGEIRGVALTSGKKGVFLAGADLKAFVTVAEAGDAAAVTERARQGQRLFSRIAALPVPTVAAINGACLGGGLELALACTSRLAADDQQVAIGLPEVRLGLIPGWGGTQRLPRLVGLSRALDLILTGKSLSARQALKAGVVDAIVPPEGLDWAAAREAQRLASGARPRRPTWPLIDRIWPGRAVALALARRRTLKQTAGRYPAPEAAIEAMRHGPARYIEDGLVREADILGPLLVGDVSRHLVGIFLASRAAASSFDGAGARSVQRLGVLGAGTMGGGIAAIAAMAGMPVRLKDVSAEALARGMKQVRARATEASRKGRMPRHQAALREALVSATVDSSGFAHCDLVVEAVVEDLAVKREVLKQMEDLVGPEAILATNTSSLSVAEIASAVSRPGRVLGLHFFNPVERMPLVEVVQAPATEPWAVDAAVGLARRLGKTPIVVQDTPGFVVNRILMAYLGGAVELLAAGGDVRSTDEALVRFGMPMGPFALLDRIGLDVAAKVAGVLKAAFPSRAGDPWLLDAMMRAGLLGVKSGRGFYLYPARASAAADGARPREVCPDVSSLLVAARHAAAGAGEALDPDSMADRLVDPMVNEAALLLEEGAVDRPDRIDLAMVMGAGFPAFRGGLLRHADQVGLPVIAGRLEARGVKPASLLKMRGRFHG